MTRIKRWLRRLAVTLAVLFALYLLAAVLSPDEPVDRSIAFDAGTLPDDLDAYLAQAEAALPDIRPGAAKRIVWAGQAGKKTGLAVVYLHGFSATSAEVQPVPERMATGLGANLFLTRLAGHGRPGEAMAGVTAGDWIEDTAEAIAIGRRLGDRVILLGTSTGATLAALAATDPELGDGIAGIAMISPNFRIRPLAARILDMPFARFWGPWVAGAEVVVEASSPAHAANWTLRYPTDALFPLAALLRAARSTDYATARVPLLVLYSPDDQVIDPSAIAPVTDRWGGKVTGVPLSLGDGDDPYNHVIAGDILSPGMTDEVTERLIGWARGL
jgi:alpha-beta hydrolase superfamily lysophospholipase